MLTVAAALSALMQYHIDHLDDQSYFANATFLRHFHWVRTKGGIQAMNISTCDPVIRVVGRITASAGPERLSSITNSEPNEPSKLAPSTLEISSTPDYVFHPTSRFGFSNLRSLITLISNESSLFGLEAQHDDLLQLNVKAKILPINLEEPMKLAFVEAEDLVGCAVEAEIELSFEPCHLEPSVLKPRINVRRAVLLSGENDPDKFLSIASYYHSLVAAVDTGDIF